MMVTALAALLLSGALHGRHQILTDVRVSSGILVPGRSLRIAPTKTGSVGFPAEAFQGVFLYRIGRAPSRVKSLNDLDGSVSLKSATDALAFVRLRTSFRLHYYFESPLALEAVSRKHVADLKDEDPRQIKGLQQPGDKTDDEEGARFIKENPGLAKILRGMAFNAVVPAGPAARFLDQYPRVTQHNGAFVIERFLLLLGPSRREYIARVVEEVTPSGGYRVRTIDRAVPKVLSKVHWNFPLLE